eukprot:2299268-Rhodomonas_salina.1
MDRMSEQWSEMRPMAVPRKQVMAAHLDRRLYAVGGWNGRSRRPLLLVFAVPSWVYTVSVCGAVLHTHLAWVLYHVGAVAPVGKLTARYRPRLAHLASRPPPPLSSSPLRCRAYLRSVESFDPAK